MKLFAVLLASVVLSAVMIGCGGDSTPPAGKMEADGDAGPPTKGEALKAREKMFKDMSEAGKKSEVNTRK